MSDMESCTLQPQVNKERSPNVRDPVLEWTGRVDASSTSSDPEWTPPRGGLAPPLERHSCDGLDGSRHFV